MPARIREGRPESDPLSILGGAPMLRSLNIVLVLFVLGIGFYVFQPEFIEKIRHFNNIDVGVLASIPIVAIVFHFLNRYSRNKRLTSRDVFWLSIVSVTLLLISLIIFYTDNETGRAILFASYFASLGWIYTNYSNGHMQRKAHTMNVLVQLRNSTEFNKQKNSVLARFPYGHRITATDVPILKAERSNATHYGSDKVPTLESAYYVANYFEFISVGVLNGDLDDTMIENTLRSIIVNWFEHLEPIIYDAQTEDNGSKNPRIFRSYIALYNRYKEAPLV
jgi:hypothetical protein